jgi:nucleoside-diphosphate-sugar epimerase
MHQRVLVTGASGFIGRQICPFLECKGLTLHALDRRSPRVVADSVDGNLEDLLALRRAAVGVDAIIHLAACRDDADFVTRLVPSNVVGLYHALEAARLEGVSRFIFASSCQVADLAEGGQKITVHDRHPTDHYGLTKLWGEDMVEMYSRRYGIAALSARLGWVVRDEREFDEMRELPHGPRLFLSRRDVRDFFYRAVTAPLARYAVVYAFSRQLGGEIFDMEPTRRLLGFEPGDTFPEAVFD